MHVPPWTTAPRRSRLCAVLVILFDRHFYLRIRPAALEAAAAFARPIIGNHTQYVLSRLAERRRGGRLAVKHRLGRGCKLRGLHGRLIAREGHGTRPAKLAPC